MYASSIIVNISYHVIHVSFLFNWQTFITLILYFYFSAHFLYFNVWFILFCWIFFIILYIMLVITRVWCCTGRRLRLGRFWHADSMLSTLPWMLSSPCEDLSPYDYSSSNSYRPYKTGGYYQYGKEHFAELLNFQCVNIMHLNIKHRHAGLNETICWTNHH